MLNPFHTVWVSLLSEAILPFISPTTQGHLLGDAQVLSIRCTVPQDGPSSFCNQVGAEVLTPFIVMRLLISLVVLPCNEKESNKEGLDHSSNGGSDHCQMFMVLSNLL